MSIKQKKTLYWGIKLDIDDILSNSQIKKTLAENDKLIPLKQVHSTLLYVGRKDNPLEEKYQDLEGRECYLLVSSYGLSGDALALKVDSVNYHSAEKEIDKAVENEKANIVPSDAVIQHITLALAENIKAVDSIKSFDVNTIELQEPMVLLGKIKKYLY